MDFPFRKHQFFVRVFTEAVKEWNQDKAPRMAAAIAFYTVFSLTPIVVVAYKLASTAFGSEAALQEILQQSAFLIGQEGADGIRLLIDNAPQRSGRSMATLFGIGVMLFAATGVFTELKDSLNTIWEIKTKPGVNILLLARDRLFGFAMVLVIWFLTLVSLLMSSGLAAASRWANVDGLRFAESMLSLAMATLLFALIFRILPDVHVAWRDVWLGAIVTASLFSLGKFLFGLYLGHSQFGTGYGAAGSLVIVIFWTYWASMVLLFGAEITQVHARLRHAPVLPDDTADTVTEKDRIQQGIPHTEGH